MDYRQQHIQPIECSVHNTVHYSSQVSADITMKSSHTKPK